MSGPTQPIQPRNAALPSNSDFLLPEPTTQPQQTPLQESLNELQNPNTNNRQAALVQLGHMGTALMVGEQLAGNHPLLTHAVRTQRFEIIGALINHMVTYGGNNSNTPDARVAAEQLQRVLTPAELTTLRFLDSTLAPRAR